MCIRYRSFMRLLPLILFLSCIFSSQNGYGQYVFENYFNYGFHPVPSFHQLKARSDNGYSFTSQVVDFPAILIAEYHTRNEMDQSDVYLSRVGDSTINNNYHTYSYRDHITPTDSSFIFAGSIGIFGAFSQAAPHRPHVDFGALASFPNSVPAFDRTYSRGQNDNLEYFYRIFTHPSEVYVLAGRAQPDSTGAGGGVFCTALDSIGSVEWTVVHQIGPFHLLKDAAQMPDGGIAFGSVMSDSLNGANAYILVTDSLGGKKWSVQIDGFGIDAIETDNNSNVYFATGGFPGIVGSFDPSGNLRWVKQIGDSTTGNWRDIQRTHDDGLVLCGMTDVGVAAATSRCMIKLDTNGNLLWGRKYPNGAPPPGGIWTSRQGAKVAECPNGDLYLGSESIYINFASFAHRTMGIIKTNSVGAGCSDSILTVQTSPAQPLLISPAQDTSYSDTAFYTYSFGPPWSAYLNNPPPYTQVCITNNCNIQLPIIATADTICLGDTISFSLGTTNDPSVLYLWSSPNAGYGTGTSFDIVANQPGLQTVTLMGIDTATNCSITTAQTFYVNQYNYSLGADYEVCVPGPVPAIGPLGMANYAWSTGDTTRVIFFSAPDTVWLEYTDQYGCSGMDTIAVTASPYSIDLGPDLPTCQGDSIQLDAGGGGINYQWSHGYTTQTAPGYPGNTYVATVTAPNGCLLRDTIVIPAIAAPMVSLGADDHLCIGDSLQLTPGAGHPSYQWSTGDTLPGIIVHNPGSYTVQVTDSNGCTNSDTILLTQSTFMTNLGPDLDICPGDTTQLDAGVGGSLYVWSHGFNTQIAPGTAGNTYIVEVTDAFGCISMDTLSINALPAPTPVLGSDTFYCQGGSILLTPGAGFSSYLWSNGDTSSSILVNGPSNSYHVTVSNTAGCTSSDSVTITQQPNPMVSFVASANGLSVQFFNFSASGVSYFWDFGDGDTSSIMNPVHTYPPGNFTPCLTVTDSFGCQDSMCTSLVLTSSDDRILRDLQISPNPASEQIRVRSEQIGIESLEIYDMRGRLVLKWPQSSNGSGNGQNEILVNIEQLSEGTYLIFVTGNELFDKRIIVIER